MSESYEVFEILRDDHDSLTDLFERPQREGTEIEDDEWQVLFNEPGALTGWNE